ncbi:MAG: hypothetical protein WB660_13165 [Candidatus Sulfotelmatobacter sp.]
MVSRLCRILRLSEDGKKIYAIVAQVNRRKPVLKKLIDGANFSEENRVGAPDSACPSLPGNEILLGLPSSPQALPNKRFAIRGHIVDLVNESEELEDEEASK